MCGLKIAVIGGGSSYTPEIIDGLLKRADELPVDELTLIDIAEGQKKLGIITSLAQRMMDRCGVKTKLTATLDRRQGIRNADFVITQFRVGGLAARVRDERFPLQYGVLGQETTGPGGFAKALRTIPVMLDICSDMEELCPAAWLINFTNPSGLVTEAVLKHTHTRCIGLCNVPIHMVMDAAKILGVDNRRVRIDFAGLNHLVWGRRVWCDGRDVTAVIIEALCDGQSLSVNNIPDLKWDPEFLHALGMMPCPYHRYYYMTPAMVQEEQECAAVGGKGTRGEQVREIEQKLFECYQDPLLNSKPEELSKRGGAYYSEAAISLISAVYNDKREIHTVNTQNRGSVSGLADDAVIETNCVIDKYGATPLTIGQLPPTIMGLIHQVKAYEELAVEAGVRGNKQQALLALASHPLVPSVEVAGRLLKDLLTINQGFLPQLDGKKMV